MAKHITPFQVSIVLLLSSGLSNHVLLLPSMLQAGKRDSWIAAILGYSYMLAWILILYFILKRMNKPFAVWLKEQTNPVGRWILTVPLAVYFFLTACTTLFSTVMWAHASYILETPTSVISFFLIALCYFLAKSGLRSIAISAYILIPFVVLFGIYVSSVNFQYKDYRFLFPILENGWGSILMGSLYAAAGVAEIIILLLLQEELTKRLSLLNLFLVFIMLLDLILAPLTGALAAYGPAEAELLRFPAYEQWRLASVGSNLNQTDFLSIFQWLSGAYIRLSLALYALVKLINLNQRKVKPVLLLVSFLVYIVCQLPISDIVYLRFLDVYYPASLGLVFTLTLLYAAFCAMGKRKSKGGSSLDQTKGEITRG